MANRAPTNERESTNSGDAATFGEALDEAFGVVVAMQNRTEIACPRSGCDGTAVASNPRAADTVAVAHSRPSSDADREVRCSEGHPVFVRYY